MAIIPTPSARLAGVVLLQSPVYRDERGYFMETYNARDLADVLGPHDFVQDNVSVSHLGVFRGMHTQLAPHAQTKLVRVLSGKLVDYVLDVNPKSPTYKQWECYELQAGDGKSLYIPKGYAHGFIALAQETVLQYKVDAPYTPHAEVCYHYASTTIASHAQKLLPQEVSMILSEKDLKGEFL